jgi:anthranilate synthase/aminodeoxychorismate synthase-like glutamine amidotransferase
MIDNHDSFTFNLVQYFAELGADVRVISNDALCIADIVALKPDRLVFSPGPGSPIQAGISLEAILFFAGKLPMLGVCLGHQCIAQAFGGQVVPARTLMHGKTSAIFHSNKGVFAGLRQPFMATRYHSLVVDPVSLPSCFRVSAWTQHNNEQDEIMGIQHRFFQLQGVQFHPESILSEQGRLLLNNFLLDVSF